MPESDESNAGTPVDQAGNTPTLSVDEVAKVAGLAMLELSPDELELFTGQLAAVLEHARDVEALDVDDVAPTQHPYPLVNVLRPDVADRTFGVDPVERAAVLEGAPLVEEEQFRVPPALGEEP